MYLTTKQVADRWGVREDYVRKLLREHQLSGLHIGKTWRVTDDSIASFEREHTTAVIPRESYTANRVTRLV